MKRCNVRFHRGSLIRARSALGTDWSVQERSCDYQGCHSSLRKPPFLQKTAIEDATERVVNLMMKDVLAAETSLSNNNRGDGQYLNIHLNNRTSLCKIGLVLDRKGSDLHCQFYEDHNIKRVCS